MPYPLGHGACVSSAHRIEWCIIQGRVWDWDWDSVWRQYHVFSFWKNPTPHELFSCSNILNVFWCCLWLLFWEAEVLLVWITRIYEPDYPELYNTNTFQQLIGSIKKCENSGVKNGTKFYLNIQLPKRKQIKKIQRLETLLEYGVPTAWTFFENLCF